MFASTGYQTGAALLKLAKTGAGVEAERGLLPRPQDLPEPSRRHRAGRRPPLRRQRPRQGFPICIELATGKIVWGGDIRNAGNGSAAVAYADGNLYFRYENGIVVLIEATPRATGEGLVRRSPNVKSPSWPHPVIAGGKLYLREQDTLYVYDVRKGRLTHLRRLEAEAQHDDALESTSYLMPVARRSPRSPRRARAAGSGWPRGRRPGPRRRAAGRCARSRSARGCGRRACRGADARRPARPAGPRAGPLMMPCFFW